MKYCLSLRDWCSGCSAPWHMYRISDSCQFRAVFTYGLFSGSLLRLPAWILQPPALIVCMHLFVRGGVWPPNPSIVAVDVEHQMRLAAISSRRVSHKMRQLLASWRVPGEKSMNHMLVREPRAPSHPILMSIITGCSQALAVIPSHPRGRVTLQSPSFSFVAIDCVLRKVCVSPLAIRGELVI